MALAVMVLFYLLYPAFVIWLCIRFPLANKIGAVLLCYAGGIVLGNIGLIPQSAVGLQNTLTEALIAIGISLLLFTIDIAAWRNTAGKAILSFVLATISIIAVSYLGVTLIRGSLPTAWKLGGMAIGLYTGGTPNLASIKAGVGASNNSFILMNTYDTVISFLYLVFAVSVAQRFFLLFLRKFSMPTAGAVGHVEEPESMTSYVGIFEGRVVRGLAGVLLLAILVGVTGLAVSMVFPKSFSTAAAILTITTLGIALSFVKRVRRTPKSFQFGMYFIYMFCTVVASMVRFSAIVHINWAILEFVALCIFGSMILHSILCAIFRIDVDTFLVTSVSAVCSPPFVPVVAASLKNRFVLISGITTGIIGYAIGNYLGISMAFLMR